MNAIAEAQKESDCFYGEVTALQDNLETFEWDDLDSFFPDQPAVPLRRPKRTAIEYAADVAEAELARLALEEGDIIPYDEFRKELGL